MFNLRCLILFVIIVTAAARQRCGYQAPMCVYDEEGRIDWKKIEKCDDVQVCGPGFVLVKKGSKQGCCEARETTKPPTSTSIDPCPYQVTCRNRYQWVHEFCACICPPIYCPSGTYQEDCDCLPITTTYPTTAMIYCTQPRCAEDEMPDASGCSCIPNPNWSSTSTSTTGEAPSTSADLTPCPDPGSCTNNWIWEPWSCTCICLETTCPPGTIDGGDCNCLPDPNWSSTTTEVEIPECVAQPCLRRNFYWNDETCQCELGCDIVKECAVGMKWNIFKCDCVVACPNVTCPENFVAIEGSCDCVCGLNEENCTGPLSYLNYDLCQCLRHPCDPVPCEAGEVINWEYCRCEPDPNCSSGDSKSQISEKKSNEKD